MQKSRFLLATALASSSLVILAQPVWAQAKKPAEAGAENDVIVVTGSRIARPELAASVPVVVVGNERIQEAGFANIQDTLSELPAFGQTISRTTSNFSTTGNGVATLNLRNLGLARTLVLLNGRRTVGIPGSSSVDVNNIPTDLIDRVEVVTGGASAVYGSEAVAGVVNFVLKDKFDGLRVRAQGTVSSKGDAARQFVSVTAGKSFSDDHGHILANFSYDNDHGLRSANRSFSANDFPNRSTFARQGLFSVDPDGIFNANGNTFTFDGNNNLKLFESANIDGFNRNAVRLLSVPVERYQGSVIGNYEFSDLVTAYVEGTYSKTKSNASLEPLAVDNTGPSPVLNFDGSAYAGIPITSPFVPVAIRNAAIANGVTTINFRRRSNDIFSRSNRNDRDFYRGVAGFKGNITAKWHYDISYEHSESHDHTLAGAILAGNYGAALSNELDANGNVICSDAAARAAGCVPINIFGANTVSAAAAAFLQLDPGPAFGGVRAGDRVRFEYNAREKQDVVSANVNGTLFELPGGPLAISVGGEYRRERSSEVYDPYTQAGLSLGNQLSNTVGRFNVKEGFAEINVPIIAEKPLLEYLGLEGAVRYADYSTVGGVVSYKFGGSYAPSKDIRFRAIYSRAVRAPNIGELFSSQSQTFLSITDPCDQGQANGDGATLVPLPTSCAAIAGISQTVASRGSFAYTTAQLQQIDGLLGGNPNLKEETADTYTVGTVITPTFFRNFSATIDYYHIKVKNAVGIIGQQVSVDQCFQTNNPTFCNNVVRNAQGFITRVNGLNLNTGSVLVSGLDVQARYDHDLNLFKTDGKFSIDVSYNHLFKQSQTPFPGGPVQNEKGQLDCPTCGRLGTGFKDKANISVTIAPGPYSLNYRVTILGPVVDTLGAPNAIRVKTFSYHNLEGRIRVGENRRLELYGGVNNLFDKQPPLFGDTNTVTFTGTRTVADTYDTFGRLFFAGVDFKF